MTRLVGALGSALIVALMLGGVAASGASANLALACYKAQKEETGGTGDYSNSSCTTEVAALKGEYVLAEPLFLIKETLWCAKITQTPETENAKTGIYETSACSKKKVNGGFTDVIVPEGERQSSVLPDVSVTLTGGTYPLNAKGTNTGTVMLGSSGGAILKGEGVTLLLTTTALGSSGTFDMDVTNVESPGNKLQCNTAGDASGVVLVEGSFAVVPLTAGVGPAGILLLLKNTELTCGTIKQKVLGDLIASLTTAGSENAELTTLGSVLEGSKGKNNISEYYNDKGTKVRVKLESDLGAEYVPADLSIVGETRLEVLGSKMFTITRR